MYAQPRLFGEVALEKGYVSIPQLYEALIIQARLEARGGPYRFLGEVLTDLGYLTERQVLDVLNELHATEGAH